MVWEGIRGAGGEGGRRWMRRERPGRVCGVRGRSRRVQGRDDALVAVVDDGIVRLRWDGSVWGKLAG